ncbi:hypothetical protein [Nocardia sputorum]|uniref:Uncharacterized protein n=1 Tax=Nocardia sputorum TaxID=2984338 RepID=A0ABN6U3Q1_9NOCA|nr:hypothetical protein [Nocardia sputorum]BDT91166.1 hypothetical protein IFM12275_11420 [Nocardia sputorum]BDT99800.1 hypothetical protein IFM12276_28290 [Nocardia sputorum]
MDAEKTSGSADATPSGTQGSGRVTQDDLRRLLATDEPDARLVLEEGHIKIEPGAGSEPRGMLILSRADLADRLGADPDAAALAEAAAELDAEVRLRGA